MEATAVREIYDAMLLNEQARELSDAAKAFRVPNYLSDMRGIERDLANVAAEMSLEVRDRMFALLHRYPENHAAVIALLRKTLEWLEADRRSPNLSAARRWDLEFVEKYIREIARFVLRQELDARGCVQGQSGGIKG